MWVGQIKEKLASGGTAFRHHARQQLNAELAMVVRFVTLRSGWSAARARSVVSTNTQQILLWKFQNLH